MASTTTNVQQLLQSLTDELIKLDTRLHAIEQAHDHGDVVNTNIQTRLSQKDVVDNLQAETKRSMIFTDKYFLNSKREDPHSFNTPEIVMEVMNNLFEESPTPQPSQLSLPSTLI
jgi:hypothetical protein